MHLYCSGAECRTAWTAFCSPEPTAVRNATSCLQQATEPQKTGKLDYLNGRRDVPKDEVATRPRQTVLRSPCT
jgi:hypothetical protein